MVLQHVVVKLIFTTFSLDVVLIIFCFADSKHNCQCAQSQARQVVAKFYIHGYKS